MDDLENAFLTQVGHGVSPNEKNSWNNSLQFMERVIRKSAIPADSGILLEYNIPATSKRIDVVVSGHDEKERKNFVIIELKQWSEAEATDMDFWFVRMLVEANECFRILLIKPIPTSNF